MLFKSLPFTPLPFLPTHTPFQSAPLSPIHIPQELELMSLKEMEKKKKKIEQESAMQVEIVTVE